MTAVEGWIPLPEFAEKYEQKLDTIHRRVGSGEWARGELVSSSEGGVSFIHEARAVEWLRVRGKISQGVLAALGAGALQTERAAS